MSSNPKDQQWLSVAEKVTKEMDGEKLSALVAQLCDALDDRYPSTSRDLFSKPSQPQTATSGSGILGYCQPKHEGEHH